MEAIQAFLETLKQGGKQTHLNLTLFPLLAPDTAICQVGAVFAVNTRVTQRRKVRKSR
jgi:hypothetical protein